MWRALQGNCYRYKVDFGGYCDSQRFVFAQYCSRRGSRGHAIPKLQVSFQAAAKKVNLGLRYLLPHNVEHIFCVGHYCQWDEYSCGSSQAIVRLNGSNRKGSISSSLKKTRSQEQQAFRRVSWEQDQIWPSKTVSLLKQDTGSGSPSKLTSKTLQESLLRVLAKTRCFKPLNSWNLMEVLLKRIWKSSIVKLNAKNVFWA